MSLLNRLLMAALLLGCGFLEVSFAQGFPVQPLGRINCIYSAVPNQVRSESLSDRTGDVRLDCTNDGVFNPAIQNNLQQYVQANITVSLNTAVTNRLNVGDDGGPNTTDSVLIVNNNNNIRPIADSEFPPSIFSGPGFGGCTIIEIDPVPAHISDPRYPCPQKGRLLGSSSLVWDGVNFPVPGAPNTLGFLPDDLNSDFVPDCQSSELLLIEDGDPLDDYSNNCFQRTTTIRITNIRANAAAVGAGGAIVANLTIFSFAGIAVTPSNQQTVANVFQGLITNYDSPISGLQCEVYHNTFYIELEEGFAGAFKTLGAPTFAQSDAGAENGYPLCDFDSEFVESVGFTPPNQTNGGGCVDPQQNAGTGGGATQATRWIFRFLGIPMGVELHVYNTIDADGSATGSGGSCNVSEGGDEDLCVERVAGTDEDGAGGVAVGDDERYEVNLDSDGNGFVVYELKDGDPFRNQSIMIPVDVWWEPDTGEDKPAIGAGQVDVTFAPLSDDGQAGNSPTPRFVDTGEDPFTFISIVRCSTTLLFPFVSNRFGFDTGLAISNTSMDWKGTAPQRGRCMIHYIGATGDDGPMPDDDVSGIIEGGEQVTWTLSMGNPVWELNGAPDFQGFVVAMCEFQFAHGYAFITDASSAVPDFAQGYLALILQFGVDENGDLVRLIDCGSRFFNGGASAAAKGFVTVRPRVYFTGCPSEALGQ